MDEITIQLFDGPAHGMFIRVSAYVSKVRFPYWEGGRMVQLTYRIIGNQGFYNG